MITEYTTGIIFTGIILCNHRYEYIQSIIPVYIIPVLYSVIIGPNVSVYTALI